MGKHMAFKVLSDFFKHIPSMEHCKNNLASLLFPNALGQHFAHAYFQFFCLDSCEQIKTGYENRQAGKQQPLAPTDASLPLTKEERI